MKTTLAYAFLLICISCNAIPDTKNESESYTDSLQKTWVEDGNLQSDTVLLISAGGPKWLMDIEKHGKTNYRYIPNYSNYRIVYVHQSQTIDSRIANMDSVLSVEAAKKEVDRNTKLLSEAISYFKQKNKTVIVIGKSFGAFIVQEYLSQEDEADRYFILAGRLCIPEAMTQQHLKGFNGEFTEDGLTYIPEHEENNLSENRTSEPVLFKNKQMLKAVYGMTNYMEKLQKSTLSKVTYIYGKVDRNIGRLTKQEIAFLTQKGVTVIGVSKDHSGVTYDFIDRLRDGRLTF